MPIFSLETFCIYAESDSTRSRHPFHRFFLWILVFIFILEMAVWGGVPKSEKKIFGIISGTFGPSLRSLWDDFDTILGLFWVFFYSQRPKRVVCFVIKCIETARAYFVEDIEIYRSVKEPGQADTKNSSYGSFLVVERPFYIGIETLFRSHLL